ncbi:ribosomal protein S18-alanine N-acetyltransferase [uncultured Tateyamaria sp.]|uniref:ribosomal protein S18-alanine N-acetyltransferase n=1 Tax=uncultured Tateyamaria sp. TaxID=455651 RepID=UPI00343460A1
MTPDTLAALHRAAFTRERPWSAQEFADLLANPHTQLSASEHGFALWRGIAGEAELLTIAVDPAHQDRGIGTQLMNSWMSEAAGTCTSAFLDVASDNASAIALYTRQGFEIIATRTNYYHRPDSRADALIMRTSLPFSVSRKSSGGLRPQGGAGADSPLPTQSALRKVSLHHTCPNGQKAVDPTPPLRPNPL